jgi:uncharacterized membrane protein YjjP (DUF1212 family)
LDSETGGLEEIGQLLLDVGSKLMVSGASTERVRVTVDRMADALGCDVELFITHRALSMTIKDSVSGLSASSILRTPPHAVNYGLVSGISILSWRTVEEKWSVDKIKAELARLESMPRYPRYVVLLLVALACASFCRIFGGDWMEMANTFLAAFLGLFVLQEARKARFNPYLCVIFASASASLVSGIGYKLGWSDTMEHAFAASVLFLIPGIPLINALTDMIDGNALNGWVRGVHAFLTIFMVAVGLLFAMLVYRI